MAQHLPLCVALRQPALVKPLIVLRGAERGREGEVVVPLGQQDADFHRGRSDAACVDHEQRLPEREQQGFRRQADGVDTDLAGRERLGEAGSQGHLERLGCVTASCDLGRRDAGRAAFGHTCDQPLVMQAPQGLPNGATLHTELFSQLGLCRHPLAGPQLTRADAFAQHVRHALEGVSPGVVCRTIAVHTPTLQLNLGPRQLCGRRQKMSGHHGRLGVRNTPSATPAAPGVPSSTRPSAASRTADSSPR
ncbi:hypothetical protein QFZ67_004174 [Streptomyces sp. V1I1]|nr:hypothetical protein [Streptomyces sp. V1I1]